MPKLHYELTKKDLVQMVLERLRGDLSTASLTEKDVKIEVITRDNYRAKEWENGDFRAVVDKEV